jgi:hypothetical protein
MKWIDIDDVFKQGRFWQPKTDRITPQLNKKPTIDQIALKHVFEGLSITPDYTRIMPGLCPDYALDYLLRVKTAANTGT